jgi:hypothetical protein
MTFNNSTLIGFVFLILISCQDSYSPIKISTDDYHNAVDKLTEVMIHDIFSPPTASRIYVYPNIAAYETLNQNSSTYKSLVNQLNGLTGLNSEKTPESLNLKLASVIAYMHVAKELVFSKEKIIIFRDSLYIKWKKTNPNEFNDAKVYGIEISEQILTWMRKDKYTETRTMPDYNIYIDHDSRWKPTPPSYMKGIEPHWNILRPFVLDSAEQFKPIPPPTYSMDEDSQFHKELMAVFNLNNTIRAKGDTSEELAIARFWDCNPFVTVNKGHFMFAEKKLHQEHTGLVFAKLLANKPMQIIIKQFMPIPKHLSQLQMLL